MGDWPWDGGRPSVDFVNTLRDRALGGRETLRGPADLAEWFAAAGLTPDRPQPADRPQPTNRPQPADRSVVTDADLAAALRLRAAIDDAAFALLAGRPIRPGDIAVVNGAAAAVSLTPLLATDDAGRPYARADTSVTALLARIAADAIELLTGEELGRLRVCAATDCGIRFVDRSPARNRQWCSMRRCGNRTKARRHYARRHHTK